MRVLVTGGAGFIGSNLVKALTNLNHDVTVLDNFSSGYRQNLSSCKPIRFYEGDVRDWALLNTIMQDIEVIYHLAASVGNKRSIDNPIVVSEINVMGTSNVLEAARKCKVRKIVTSSSAGIFGELKTLPIAENHAIEPRTPYACSKLYAEKISLAYADLYEIEAICLRYFNVYGPHQRFDAYGNVIPIFVFKLLQNEILSVFGDGEQTRDFVNVHDVVQANLLAGEAKNVTGVFNIASGEAISINYLIAALNAAAGMKAKVEFTAPRAGDVRDSLADISAARKALRYIPKVTLNEGLKEYVNWARNEMLGKVMIK